MVARRIDNGAYAILVSGPLPPTFPSRAGYIVLTLWSSRSKERCRGWQELQWVKPRRELNLPFSQLTMGLIGGTQFALSMHGLLFQKNPGLRRDVFDLTRPALNFVLMAEGMGARAQRCPTDPRAAGRNAAPVQWPVGIAGVPATMATTAEEFDTQVAAAMAVPGCLAPPLPLCLPFASSCSSCPRPLLLLRTILIFSGRSLAIMSEICG